MSMILENNYKKYKCEHCDSIIGIEPSDIHIGVYAAKYITCPCCGEESFYSEGEKLTRDNFSFPLHFNFSKTKRSVHVKDSEIEKYIKKGIDYFRNNKSENFYYVATGDSIVFVIRYSGDEDYFVVVSDKYYSVEIDFDEVDYE